MPFVEHFTITSSSEFTPGGEIGTYNYPFLISHSTLLSNDENIIVLFARI